MKFKPAPLAELIEVDTWQSAYAVSVELMDADETLLGVDFDTPSLALVAHRLLSAPEGLETPSKVLRIINLPDDLAALINEPLTTAYENAVVGFAREVGLNLVGCGSNKHADERLGFDHIRTHAVSGLHARVMREGCNVPMEWVARAMGYKSVESIKQMETGKSPMTLRYCLLLHELLELRDRVAGVRQRPGQGHPANPLRGDVQTFLTDAGMAAAGVELVLWGEVLPAAFHRACAREAHRHFGAGKVLEISPWEL